MALMDPRGEEMPHTHPLEGSRPRSQSPLPLDPDSAPTCSTEKPQVRGWIFARLSRNSLQTHCIQIINNVAP